MKRADRARTLTRLVDEGQHELKFIRARESVHVVAHPDDWPDSVTMPRNTEEAAVLGLMLGEMWTVCGVRLVRHRGGFEQSAALVSHFPDEHLCQRCYAAFGDRSVLIFEANQDDGEDPTQLGRLNADLTSRGAPPIQ